MAACIPREPSPNPRVTAQSIDARLCLKLACFPGCLLRVSEPAAGRCACARTLCFSYCAPARISRTRRRATGNSPEVPSLTRRQVIQPPTPTWYLLSYFVCFNTRAAPNAKPTPGPARTPIGLGERTLDGRASRPMRHAQLVLCRTGFSNYSCRPNISSALSERLSSTS